MTNKRTPEDEWLRTQFNNLRIHHELDEFIKRTLKPSRQSAMVDDEAVQKEKTEDYKAQAVRAKKIDYIKDFIAERNKPVVEVASSSLGSNQKSGFFAKIGHEMRQMLNVFIAVNHAISELFKKKMAPSDSRHPAVKNRKFSQVVNKPVQRQREDLRLNELLLHKVAESKVNINSDGLPKAVQERPKTETLNKQKIIKQQQDRLRNVLSNEIRKEQKTVL